MKNPECLVAIRCTVFNHEPYLRDCLNGFVMQKTNFKFVAIVHDDCSTDKSADIIREYAEKYHDIIKPIYETENQWSKHDGSLDRIMSEAIAETGAKYVALCEGDDYWIDPYKLQKQVDFLEAHENYIACFHNARIKYQNGWRLFNDLNENNHPTTEDIIKRHWFISTQTLIYRNIPLSYQEWKKNIISGDYWLELMLAKEGKFYYMDDVMAVYRQSGTGLSAMLNSRKIAMFDQLIYLLSHMKEEYAGKYADAFEQSIANYEAQKLDVIRSTDPVKKWFYRKTYTRAIKRWLGKWV